MKIVKILNDLPWLDYKEIEGRIWAVIQPHVARDDNCTGFGIIIIQELKGLKIQNKYLTDILKERLWQVEKRKSFFFFTPIEKGTPDSYWIGVTEPTRYPKERARTVMFGMASKKEGWSGRVIKKMGRVIELDANTQKKIEISQISKNGARIVWQNKDWESMALLFK